MTAVATEVHAQAATLPQPTQAASLVRVEQSAAPLARVAEGPLTFTPEQSQMIRDTYANGASEEEFAVLLEVSKARRLNPLLRQCFYVKRYDSVKRREVWAVQVSIDGLRAIAERTGLYDGQDEPEYLYARDADGKKPRLAGCKVKVYKKGIARPFVGFCVFSEYVQTTRNGDVTKFWKEKPHVMIAKCAEALALRKAFPEDTGNLYIPEEINDDGEARDERRDERREDRRERVTEDGEVVDERRDARGDGPADEAKSIEGAKREIDKIQTRDDRKRVQTQIMRKGFSSAALKELWAHLEAHDNKMIAAAHNDNGGR